jgi:hypothetical protein
VLRANLLGDAKFVHPTLSTTPRTKTYPWGPRKGRRERVGHPEIFARYARAKATADPPLREG